MADEQLHDLRFPGLHRGDMFRHKDENGYDWLFKLREVVQDTNEAMNYRLLVIEGPEGEIGKELPMTCRRADKPMRKRIIAGLVEEAAAGEQGLTPERLILTIRELQGTKSELRGYVLSGDKAHVRDIMAYARKQGWVASDEAGLIFRKTISRMAKENSMTFRYASGWLRLIPDGERPRKFGLRDAESREVDAKKLWSGMKLILEAFGHKIKGTPE